MEGEDCQTQRTESAARTSNEASLEKTTSRLGDKCFVCQHEFTKPFELDEASEILLCSSCTMGRVHREPCAHNLFRSEFVANSGEYQCPGCREQSWVRPESMRFWYDNGFDEQWITGIVTYIWLWAFSELVFLFEYVRLGTNYGCALGCVFLPVLSGFLANRRLTKNRGTLVPRSEVLFHLLIITLFTGFSTGRMWSAFPCHVAFWFYLCISHPFFQTTRPKPSHRIFYYDDGERESVEKDS